MDTSEQKTLFNSNRTYAGENRYKTQKSIFNKIQSSIGLYTYMNSYSCLNLYHIRNTNVGNLKKNSKF
jgi:hypothetical protein